MPQPGSMRENFRASRALKAKVRFARTARFESGLSAGVPGRGFSARRFAAQIICLDHIDLLYIQYLIHPLDYILYFWG